jgi:diadenosine tetraphosphate (Ap4A) HIT family hydrolase
MNCPFCPATADDDQLLIARLECCDLLLNRDQFFAGYCLLVSRRHVSELFHLSPAERQTMMEEVSRVAAALASLYLPAKMNYELLGNMVPHIHWHLVPRHLRDPLWPRPIWSEPHTPRHLCAPEYATIIAAIRGALDGGA